VNRIMYFGGGSALAIALALAMGSTAAAQDTATEVEEVVVTGSLIRGTPEDAALPVDVIGQEELEKQGSPSTVELLKALPVSNGVLGDTNQFDSRAQGSEGSGSVNLRGLGPHRTLVLLNGRRLPINPFALAGSGAVDTNTIPSAAIGRVEVLKEGAAATYGSDAIGGVVNFITRKLDGVEVGAAYRFIQGSDGDYNAHVNFGQDWDRADAFFSFGYYHRSELSVRERDWANRPYEDNPEGGWSAAGDPATFVPLLSTNTRFRDPQCADLGGYEGFSGFTPVCAWHYTPFDNLVEEESRYQAFGEFNYQIDEKTRAHVDVNWSSTDVPHWRTSPSYALLSTPTASVGSVAGNYFVPGNNPGLIALRADNPTIPATYAATTLAPGVIAGNDVTISSGTAAFGALLVASRPFGLGGNPMFGYGSSEGKREFDAWRISGGLQGEFSNAINWDVNITYGQQTGVRTGYDTVVNRYQLALRGFGSLASDVAAGEGCTAAETANYTTGAGNSTLGCHFFNPFSNAIPQNVFTGQTTDTFQSGLMPDMGGTGLENSADLARWFFVEQWTEQTAAVMTFDALLSGQFGFELPGGAPGWALGYQHRKDSFESAYNEWANREVNPCIDTPTSGNTTCANPNGPLAFLGVAVPVDLSRNVNAVFGELSLPVTDAIQVQLAARYENYGRTGSTFDPKISVRWQLTDMFAVRASAGSTFRAPQVTALTDNFITSLQNIGGTFRAVDIYGNPDLEPETAKTYTVGFIADIGGFNATLDYWSFDFENPINTDPVAGIVDTFFPTTVAADDPDANNTGSGTYSRNIGRCNNPNFDPLQERFSFLADACGLSNVQRLRTDTVNGAGVKTSGIDLLANYDFGDLGFAELNIGMSATYVLEYETEATLVEGIKVADAFDGVGLLNYQTTAYPIPQLKGEVFIELSRDIHNLRWTTRYIDSYTDQRTAPFLEGIYHGPTSYLNSFTVAEGKEIDSTIISDLTYRGQFPMETTLVVAVENIFDQDPSFARLDLNYDPFTGDPLGRTVKVSLTKRF
jgi:iron complex outermembrane receptor protein